MNFRTVTIASILIVLIGSLIGWSSTDSRTDGASASATETVDSIDIDDSNVRENPVIEGSDDEIDIKVPKYIKQSANHIKMNGADWSKMRKSLSQCRKAPFSVVHIGDSHLQADIATGAVREFLQYDYGNAGRGLAIPFRLARTNEPWDYTISSNRPWNSSKILHRPWTVPMGFTGISVSPTSSMSDIFVGTRDDSDYNPFNTLTIYHTGTLNVSSITNREGKAIGFTQTPVDGGTRIKLASEENGVRLNFSSGNLVINGINLSGNRPGVFYHTIGNNGATFSAYDNIPDVGLGISYLRPNLVIVSVGTNDAFGRFDAAAFNRSMDSVIKKIRKANPEAAILMTTPIECQKSVYTTATKGKRTSKSRHGYGVNSNVALVRNEIMKYAEKNNIALYDWYEVAGGKGASNLWIADDLYGGDRVHHTAKGYRLYGYLLYQALNEAFKTK